MQVQDDKPYDAINITPMLEHAYVLLVIFIQIGRPACRERG